MCFGLKVILHFLWKSFVEDQGCAKYSLAFGISKYEAEVRRHTSLLHGELDTLRKAEEREGIAREWVVRAILRRVAIKNLRLESLF